MIEGDFEFLIDAVNLFEKFYNYKESGNYISAKLRMFFEKFVIPQKFNRGMMFRKKKIKERKPNRYDNRYLKQVKNSKKLKKTHKLKDEGHLEGKRILASKKGKKGIKGKNKAAKKAPLRTAKILFNKEFLKFYNIIDALPEPTKTHIFKMSKRSVDVDKFQKFFAPKDGLDISSYDGANGFGLTSEEFYKKLFSYRKSDPSDPNLLYFLLDFHLDKKKKMIK